MLRLNVQLFGGRGADSGYSGDTSTGGDGRKVSRFYDKTTKYKGMTMHEFENAIRDKKTEFIGIYDKNGKLIVAGTSGNKGSVAIPSNAPGFENAYTMTHNHPYDNGRVIGGSFSGADIQSHLRFNLGETRAVTNGPNEHTYIFRNKKGSSQSQKQMAKIARNFDRKYTREANKSVDKVTKKLSKKGKSLGNKGGQVYIGTAKRLWKNADVQRYGYEYVEVKKAHW